MVLADKQSIRQKVKTVEKVKTWQLAILLLMAGFVAATFLRLNNIGMIERRDAVYAADEEGDSVKIQKRLYDLQRYVAAHMNTDPGRVALEHSYQRDNDKLKDEFATNSSGLPNGSAHQQAIAVCDPIAQANGWRWPDVRYTNCLEEELAKYPGSEEITAFKPLPVEAYYHTFISPLWSPDYAGWSLLVCLFIMLVIILRLVTLGILKIMLVAQYRRL